MSLSIQATPTLLTTTDSNLQEEQEQQNMNNGAAEESTLNFLHNVGDQGGVQEARLKNELIDVMSTEHRPHLRVQLLEVILRSTNQEVLEALATSSKACRNYHEWIKDALKDDDWITIGKMLKALDHLPLSTKTLMDYKLGKAVRIIKEKAVAQDKEEINAEAARLMHKWNEQHNKDKANGEKRKQPPTNATNPNKKTLRLAISSEPPAKKVQAKTDMNFFERLNNGIRKPAVGLRREESFIVESTTDSVPRYNYYSNHHINKVGQAQTRAPLTELHQQYYNNSSISSLVSSPQSLSPTSSSTLAGPSSSSSSIAVPSLSSTSGLNDYSLSNLNSKKRNGKKVNFKDDSLVKVRYYSKHSWKTSDSPHELFEDEEDDHMHERHNGHLKSSHIEFPHLKSHSIRDSTINVWQPPIRLQLSQECKHAGQVDTEEVRMQRHRQSLTPPVIYQSDTDIPDSPEEPDSPGCSNETGVKNIPLEDLASYDQEPTPEEEKHYYYDDQPSNITPASVPTPAPTAPVAVPVSSSTGSLSSVYPEVNFPQLQALLNGVFGSTSTSSSVSNSKMPSSSANLTYQQQQSLPTGPAAGTSPQPNNNYHYNNSSGGSHYHSSSSSSHRQSHRGTPQHHKRSNKRKNAPPCRYVKKRGGCERGAACKFSHDL